MLLHAHSLRGLRSNECTEAVLVARFVCHPAYNKDTMQADLCLLRLSRDANCGQALRARGVLPMLDSDATSYRKAGTLVTVAGWGSSRGSYSDTDEIVAVWPDTLREVTVPIVDKAVCNAQVRLG